MAQTKLKSKAENGPDSSIYSSSQLGRVATAMVSGNCPADNSFCQQPREDRKPKFQLCSIKYQEMDMNLKEIEVYASLLWGACPEQVTHTLKSNPHELAFPKNTSKKHFL